MLQINTFFVVLLKKKFRHSFVLPKKYSFREINKFPKRYKLLTPHVTFWMAKQLKTIHKNTFRPSPSYFFLIQLLFHTN